jgi:two-component system LytT family response regulator
MRVMIVDDERPARDKLRRLLEQEPDLTAIDEARDGIEALERLPAFAPDLLLLDIQMPEITGLDLAASLPSPAPLVVFVTAYDEYAIRAFDANAVDYLLKPYDQQRLQRALRRVRERLAARAMGAAPALAPAAGPPMPAVTQLLVPERGGTRIVKVEQIQWIETADNYVVLHTADGQPLMRQTMGGLLDKLGPRFQRCHRRAAVQLDWIASVQTLDKGDGELILRGGARVPCSRQYRIELMDRLQSPSHGRAPEPPPSR